MGFCVGGSATFIIGAVLGLLAIAVGLHSGIVTRFDLLPKANLNTLNFWSQIAFAFVGLELAAVVSARSATPVAISREPLSLAASYPQSSIWA